MSVNPELRAQLKASFAGQKKSAEYNTNPRQWANDKLGVFLWSKQHEITESVRDNKRTVVASCHGSGKALTLDTLLPMSDGGYISMGDVQPGDKLMDEMYMACTVTAVTAVEMRPTAEVRFVHTDDGRTSSLRSSYEHEWMVLTQQAQAAITVLCSRHGIRKPDWSYWMHRARKFETSHLQLALIGGQALVPAARTTGTWRQDSGDEGRSVLPGSEKNPLVQHFMDMGGVDDQGRLCLRKAVPVTPEQANQPGRRFLSVPSEIKTARLLLEDQGTRTLLHKERKGYMMYYTLSVTSNPMDVLSYAAPHGMPTMSAGDVEAIVLQRWTESINNPMPTVERPARMGGWTIQRIVAMEPAYVKCVEVNSLSHMYLAGTDAIPTHNSMIASVIAAWWIDTHPPGTAIVVSTAPTYAQVHAILWEEIRKHHATAKEKGLPLPGTITMADNWNLPGGQLVGFGRKPKDGDRHAFQGIHRRYVLAILDEACGVPEELWTGAEAITTNEGCRILAIGNPDDRETEFGKNFVDPATAGDWNRISIPAATTPNLTGEKVPPLLNEVLVSKSWCDERKRAWGEDDPRYISKVLAEFPEQNAASLFSPAVIATAFEEAGRKLQGVPMTLYFGVDVARFGGDLNVLTMYDGIRVTVVDSWSGVDTVSSAALVLTKVGDILKDRKVGHADIRVDAVGLGAGVVDTLAARRMELEQDLYGTGREPWFTVREMHGSAAAPKDVGGSVQGYGNARAWWYDQLKHLMRSGSIEIALHAKLKEEFEGVRYEYKGGKLYIESKEDIRKRNGKSPDFADSVVYATAPVHEGLMPGQTVSEDAHDLAEDVYDLDAEMARENSIAPY